jgi:hypothetical protein
MQLSAVKKSACLQMFHTTFLKSLQIMLKKIFLALFKPNHQPEMILSNSSTNDPFAQPKGEVLAVELINRLWVSNKTANDKHSKAMIKNVAEKMMEDCRKVLSSTDPVRVNRQLLAESVLRCAKFQVLVIAPEPEFDGTGLRGRLGITGELAARVLELIKTDKEFDTFPEGLSFAKAGAQIQYAHRRAWASMNLFERLRHEFDDINPEQSKDWFRPFFASQCAYAESHFREALGMPNVLGVDSDTGITLGAMYGNYMDIVLSGERFPDVTWEEKFLQLVNPKSVWNE